MNKKTKILWALLCSSSSIDSESNNLSVANIIEEITVGKEAFVNDATRIELGVNLQILSLIKKIKNIAVVKVDMRIKFIDPNNTELNSFDYSLEIPSDKLRMRQRINVPTLPITTAGEYRFEFHVKEEGGSKFENSAEIPLIINIK